MSSITIAGTQVAGIAGSHLNHAMTEASLSTARLSSGNRIVRSGDDVAGLSVATKLQSTVSTLKSSLGNAIQAESYLSIADDSLSSIDEMLQRMTALSVQAGSGALTDNERSFLNQEFRNLMDEIDRTAESSTFNNVNVLQRAKPIPYQGLDYDTTAGKRATAYMDFTNNVIAGRDFLINDVTITEGVDFDSGATIIETVNNLAKALNEHSNIEIRKAIYKADGNRLTITHSGGGYVSNMFEINEAVSSARTQFNLIGGSPVRGSERYILDGGTDEGINIGTISAEQIDNGTGIFTAQNQTPSEIFYELDKDLASNFVEDEFLAVYTGGLAQRFTFKETPNAADNREVQLGDSLEDSIRNLASALNSNFLDPSITGGFEYSYGTMQFEAVRDGEKLYLRTVYDGDGEIYNDSIATEFNIAEFGNGILSTGSSSYDFDSGESVGGVHTSGISNKDFIGRISGFSTIYETTDQVKSSITIGDYTYTADISDTNPLADTVIQFTSDGGGYFQVELAAGSGMNVTNAGEALLYSEALDAGFASFNFFQERKLEYIQSDSDMNLTNITYNTSRTDPIIIEDVSVKSTEETGGTAEITFTIGGETYKSFKDIGSEIGEYEIFDFQLNRDSEERITISTENISYDLSTNEGAAEFEEQLKAALTSPEQFKRVPDAEEVRMFISQDEEYDINVKIDITSTKALFEDTEIDITTSENAIIANEAINEAINEITKRRADVGSQQSRLGYAIAQIQTSITNQDQARATLMDTDILNESTNYAMQQVLISTSVSMIAQANSLHQNIVQTLYDSM